MRHHCKYSFSLIWNCTKKRKVSEQSSQSIIYSICLLFQRPKDGLSIKLISQIEIFILFCPWCNISLIFRPLMAKLRENLSATSIFKKGSWLFRNKQARKRELRKKKKNLLFKRLGHKFGLVTLKISSRNLWNITIFRENQPL